MINLIKMNLYRLLHTKSMYVILMALLFLCGVSAYMGTNMDEIESYAAQQEQEIPQNAADLSVDPEEEPGADFGISVQSPESSDGKPASFLEYFCSDIASGLLLIFFSIAVSIFIYAEEKSGFVKNISGQTKYKADIYLSKLFPLIVYFLVCMLCYGLVQFIFLKYFYGSKLLFGVEHMAAALRMLGIQFLLHTAFACGLVMLVTVCKSTTIAITAGILTACGFSSILTNALKKFFHISIEDWLVCQNIRTVGWNTPDKDMFHALAVGILFIVVYNLAGTIWFVKKDVV